MLIQLHADSGGDLDGDGDADLAVPIGGGGVPAVPGLLHQSVR